MTEHTCFILKMLEDLPE